MDGVDKNAAVPKREPLKCFYTKLKELQDYHRNFTPAGAKIEYKGAKVMLDRVFQAPRAPPAFSGEESDGKYVDMEVLYHEFLNLKKIREAVEQPGGYIWYLQNFDHFHEIPINLKQRLLRPYRRYLNNLVEYLTEFFKKTQPLADFEIVEKQFENDFEHKWNEGTVRGWEGCGPSDEHLGNDHNGPLGHQGNHDSQKDSALFCEACAKQFTNQNVYVVASLDNIETLRGKEASTERGEHAESAGCFSGLQASCCLSKRPEDR